MPASVLHSHKVRQYKAQYRLLTVAEPSQQRLCDAEAPGVSQDTPSAHRKKGLSVNCSKASYPGACSVLRCVHGLYTA